MIRRYRTQIRTRLAMWHVLVLAVVLIAYVAAASYLLLADLRRQLAYHAVQDLETVEGLLFFDASGALRFRDDYHNHPESRYVLDRFLEVRDISGRVLYRNAKLGQRSLGEYLLPGEGEAGYSERALTLSDGTRVQAASRRHSIEGRPTVIRVAYGEERLWSEFRSELLMLVAPLPFILAIAGWLLFRLTSHALEPIGMMARRADEITGERLAERLPVDPKHGELNQLASVFNAMLARLEHSFEAMRRFTADASHELRTPLTAIRSVGEVALQRHETGEAYRDVIGSMLEEVNRLTALVDNLLTLSRADSSSIAAAAVTFHAGELARECVSLVEVLAEEKRQKLTLDIVEDARMDGDWLLLRQAFLNLLTNAIKYSGVGDEITISVGMDDRGMVRWAVSDLGPGIAEEHAARIFDRFYRVDRARSRQTGGTGLGLSIARSMIEAHGGTLSVRSEPGKGSTFVAVLPSRPAAASG
jgi:heavy metal sensor kinase